MLAGVGLNTCLKSGDAKCTGFDPSAHFLLAPGIRIVDVFGLYMDFDYGWWTPDAPDVSLDTMNIMPTARLFYDFGVGELYGGLGVGYSRIEQDGMALDGGGTQTVTWDGFANPKVNMGLVFKVGGPVALGVNLDYVMNADGTGEVCVVQYHADGTKTKGCEDNDTGDMQDQLLVSALIKLHF